MDAEYCGSLACSLLRGNALLFLRHNAATTAIGQHANNYADVKALLRQQYAVVDEVRNARDRLKTLVQTKSVSAYQSLFEHTMLQITDASDAEQLHSFVWGLKDRIKSEVRLRNP